MERINTKTESLFGVDYSEWMGGSVIINPEAVRAMAWAL
jgi:hypothetical protein